MTIISQREYLVYWILESWEEEHLHMKNSYKKKIKMSVDRRVFYKCKKKRDKKNSAV